MNSAEADDEADDPGALAAVGCLRAISTILESVSRLPHLFVQVEPTLLPIMRRMLTTDGQGNPHVNFFVMQGPTPTVLVYFLLHLNNFFFDISGVSLFESLSYVNFDFALIF